MKKLISIVTPCYNEALNVRACRDAVRRIFERELPDCDYEHIFCDNDSKDGTPAILRELAAEDPHVQVIFNSRNFGPFRSMFNGILSTSGDAVLCFLPADLQDPPELIPQMVERWQSGYEVVYGVRAQREENFLMRGIRRVYYRLVTRLADIEIPMNVGEFQLVDRCVIEALHRLRRLLSLRPRHDRQLRLPEQPAWSTPGNAGKGDFPRTALSPDRPGTQRAGVVHQRAAAAVHLLRPGRFPV